MISNRAASSAWYNRKPTRAALLCLFLAAFVIRSCTFHFFIKPGEYYNQPDALDYNFATLILRYTGSMTPPKSTPIVWRTPGYPAFMLPFYIWQKATPNTKFSDNAPSQHAVIRAQIALCSFIPMVLLFLAFLLSGSWLLSWAVAAISMVHIGFVTTSTFLLTDALGSLLFYVFLIYLYLTWFRAGNYLSPAQPGKAWHENPNKTLFVAGLLLAAYTWMRPMGVFVGQCTTLLLLLAPALNLVERLKRAAVFFISFFTPLLPWYIRNYRLTGSWFFCPIQGEYLRVFAAPKLVRRVTGVNYQQAMNMLGQDLGRRVKLYTLANPGAPLFIHLLSGSVALPWIKQFPLQFAYDWIQQVIKTTFDPYSYRLAKIGYGTSMSDPLEEFLTENWYETLYKSPASFWMHAIGWIEFLSMIVLWTGFFAGLYQFVLKPLYLYFKQNVPLSNTTIVWLLVLPMIAFVIVPSGGFGCARLRLPVEPLIIILSGIWYLQFVQPKNEAKRA